MTFDLTEDEMVGLAALLKRTIEGDRHPLSPRLRPLKAIFAKLKPEPVREQLPPEPVCTTASRPSQESRPASRLDLPPQVAICRRNTLKWIRKMVDTAAADIASKWWRVNLGRVWRTLAVLVLLGFYPRPGLRPLSARPQLLPLELQL
jgi:hypothetical protein